MMMILIPILLFHVWKTLRFFIPFPLLRHKEQSEARIFLLNNEMLKCFCYARKIRRNYFQFEKSYFIFFRAFRFSFCGRSSSRWKSNTLLCKKTFFPLSSFSSIFNARDQKPTTRLTQTGLSIILKEYYLAPQETGDSSYSFLSSLRSNMKKIEDFFPFSWENILWPST